MLLGSTSVEGAGWKAACDAGTSRRLPSIPTSHLLRLQVRGEAVVGHYPLLRPGGLASQPAV